MPVRRPLKRVGSDLRVMTAAEVTQIVNEVIRLYGNDPAVTLEVTEDAADGTVYEQKLGTLVDRRFNASPAATAAAPFPTPELPSYFTVNYIRVLQELNWRSSYPNRNRAGSPYAQHSYPMYYDENSNYIRAMSKADILDTFIEPAFQRLTNSSLNITDNAGTYFVSTSLSESDATLLSSTPIAQDTQGDITAYNAGDLPEDVDQINSGATISYYLHRFNTLPEASFTLPMVQFGSNGDFKVIDRTVFRSMLSDLMKYWAVDLADQTNTSIRYQFGTSTYLTSQGLSTRGTAITDTYALNYVERTDQDAPDPNATVYYAQNVPSGTPTVQSTNYLGIGLL